MDPFVGHPGLSPGTVEARAYQLQAVDESISGSMLLVLPTAAGKTAVAWMAIAERLEVDAGWVLVIAPTVALINQHLESTTPVLVNRSEINPISISGQQPVVKRPGLWPSSRLVFATPQVVRNDILRGSLSLAACSLLVIDEAHHCTGDHAMAQVAELYISQSEDPLILATTASPGSKTEQVEEVCNRLAVQRIHLRARDDPMMAEHVSGLEITETTVEVPIQIRNLAEPFRVWQEGIVDREKRLGRYVIPGLISHRGLSNAMERAQAAISRGEASAYRSISQIATAMRLHHLINHLLCQGIAASREFLDRMVREDGKSRSANDFLRDPRVRGLVGSLAEMEEVHSKVGAVRRLVRQRLRRDVESRVIVFATYRDTVNALEQAIVGLEGVRPVQFIGQSSRGGTGGLSPKQQIERLGNFRSGSANVLVATSVGEEGLDIPSADLVIFYEPVSSEIRTIQRRGRTGRRREGEVVVLIAEGTRDEGARAAAVRKEEFMHKAVRRVGRRLYRGPHTDLSNLSRFVVVQDGSSIPAAEFVLDARDRHRAELAISDDTVVIEQGRQAPSALPPETFRPTGQIGLEQFTTTGEEPGTSHQ
ncbi:MAG: helicase-related protein [Candidatus Thalassarchaeaceae archaeon]|nr:helicase-related protein [Candidatus Thalassarchaeaceae archaeon]